MTAPRRARPAGPVRRGPSTIVEMGVALAGGAAWFAVMTGVAAAGLPDSVAGVAVVAVTALGATWAALRWWSVVTAVTIGVASAVAVDWYWIPPTHDASVPDARNALALAVYLVTATVLGELAVRTSRQASRADLARAALADEQAALGRVATLVARGSAPAEVFASVTQEVEGLLKADVAALLRYEPDGTATVLAAWRDGAPYAPRATRLELDGSNVVAEVHRTGAAARSDDTSTATGPLADTMRDLGVRATAASPVTVAGGAWGVMVVAWRTAQSTADVEPRLRQFTDLTATAIANAEAWTELVASRSRIVAAADGARRHIERDLHDGVQQHLVALALRLRMAVDDADPGSDLREELAQVHGGLVAALEELREISHGIHPAILSEGGLRPALATLGRRAPLPVEVSASIDERLPDQVEVGLYYVVAETLTNAYKHADASVVHVELEETPAEIVLVVRDDGVGGASTDGGSGLQGLRDRVHALGGSFQLTSRRGGGTAVEVRVPRAGDVAGSGEPVVA